MNVVFFSVIGILAMKEAILERGLEHHLGFEQNVWRDSHLIDSPRKATFTAHEESRKNIQLSDDQQKTLRSIT